jgi:hypothetical protein
MSGIKLQTIHAAQRDFLTIWKDAALEISVLIAAKSEYAS